jgi:hypothetical protein
MGGYFNVQHFSLVGRKDRHHPKARSLSKSSVPLSSTVCGMFVRHCAGGLRLTEMSGGTAVVQGEVLEMSQDQDCSSFCI